MPLKLLRDQLLLPGARLRQLIGRKGREWASKINIALVRKPLPILKNPSRELNLNLEFVASHFALAVGGLNFIQVGAYDGKSGDPLNRLIRKYHWRGILLEPQPEAFQCLRENYKDEKQLLFKNAAISHHDGTQNLYRVKKAGGDPTWISESASFNKAHLLKYRKIIPDIEERIETVEIETVTFDTLLKQSNFPTVDLLQVDAEGFDFQIIKLFDICRRKPAIINFEHVNLSLADWNECAEFLLDCGYSVNVAGQDTLAYRSPY